MFFRALAAIITADAIDRHLREQQRQRFEQRAAGAAPGSAVAPVPTSPAGALRHSDYVTPERPR